MFLMGPSVVVFLINFSVLVSVHVPVLIDSASCKARLFSSSFPKHNQGTRNGSVDASK